MLHTPKFRTTPVPVTAAHSSVSPNFTHNYVAYASIGLLSMTLYKFYTPLLRPLNAIKRLAQRCLSYLRGLWHGSASSQTQGQSASRPSIVGSPRPPSSSIAAAPLLDQTPAPNAHYGAITPAVTAEHSPPRPVSPFVVAYNNRQRELQKRLQEEALAKQEEKRKLEETNRARRQRWRP